MSSEIIKPILKTFNCPSCGATLEIKAVGTTISVSCKSCKSIIDVNDPNYKIIANAKSKMTIEPIIPIGSKGTFSGKIYEVIGFMQRRDGTFYWREYLLFNPYLGFRWLTEIDGHWSYVKKIHKLDYSLGVSGSEKYKNKNFKLFNRGEAIVDYVIGEFYWRVKVGERVRMYDFIAPPYMISKEEGSGEINWSQSIYLEKERVAAIFNMDEADLPIQSGVAANQPSALKKQLKEVFKLAFYTVSFCFLLHVLFFFFRGNETLLDYKYFPAKKYNRSTMSGKYEEIKSNEFEIRGDNKNLSIELNSNVSNSWLFLDIMMVNKSTGEAIPLPIEVSYYFGSDWSEGSRTTTKYEFNIPKGIYYLMIEPSTGGRTIVNQYARVKLKSDVIIFNNLYWLLGLSIIPIFFVGIRSRSFEVQRWSNSSENPYETED